MSKTGKVIVTVLVVVLFFMIGTILQAAGISKTFMALLGLGLIFGLRNMWKKPKSKNKSEEISLKKSKDD